MFKNSFASSKTNNRLITTFNKITNIRRIQNKFLKIEASRKKEKKQDPISSENQELKLRVKIKRKNLKTIPC